jgi:hypothetical protein
MTSNVIDMRQYQQTHPTIKAKGIATRRFNDAWRLHERFAERLAATSDPKYLDAAQRAFEVSLDVGYRLDAMGGAL